MSKHKSLGRRAFLRLAALATGTVALASCAPAPPAAPSAPASPQVTKAPAAPTKAPAAAPTTPPATAPTKAPAAAPTTGSAAVTPSAPASPQTAKAPAATTAVPAATKAPAAEQKIGKSLIGKLEGPEIITDAARFPKTFKEAPILADLVKAGKLPPVQERIGQDPLVTKPVHEIGKYGGQWRRGFTGPADGFNGVRAGAGMDHPLYVDYTGYKVVPNIAKGWEVGDGGRTFTLFLRRGMKWSDGQPLTAEDFQFWFEDMYQNKDLVPLPEPLLSINGKPGTVEKVDSFTVRFKFPDPYYVFLEVLAYGNPLSTPTWYGKRGQGGYAPAHYLKQFHPKYVAKEELDRKVKDAKFDNWVSLMKFKNDWCLNPELPVVTPWKTTSPVNTPVWTLERNPYSIWVDTEGNQLPYIDRIVLTLAENLEVVNLRAIAGEYDKQSRHIDIAKLPVYLENQQKGGYRVSIQPMDTGSDCGIGFNLSFEADPEVAKWIANADFRRALSLGIRRDQINESFFLGIGVIGSSAPAESNPYSPGPEYRTLWSTYEPQKANELLDKIGLDKKDAEGFRLRSDGKGRLRVEAETSAGMLLQSTQIMEMVREHWKKIGIDLLVQEQERSLLEKRQQANEAQLRAHSNEGSEILFNTQGGEKVMPISAREANGPLYGRWFQSGGTQGKEPPPRLREAMEKWRKGFGVPEAERMKLGKEIWQAAIEEQWSIGIVGQAGAFSGVMISKVDMGNVPARYANINVVWPPANARTMTFFWKK